MDLIRPQDVIDRLDRFMGNPALAGRARNG